MSKLSWANRLASLAIFIAWIPARAVEEAKAEPPKAEVAKADENKVEAPKVDESKVQAGKDDDAAPDIEREAARAAAASPVAEASTPDHRYSADIDDAELERRWKEDPASLGPISVGFADAGRLINGVQFPESERWIILDGPRSYATQDLIDGVVAAAEEVNALFPDTPRLQIGHISREDGGWLRPHLSHQAGRDIDLPRNWALFRSLIVLGDVEFVLVDRQIQKRLYDYALSIGEDKDWLDSLFHAGMKSVVFHARRHRDHFHVRYFSGRAQELGRRIQPLLPKGKPEYNLAIHRVKQGDTLGALARKYDTTLTSIRKLNHLTGNLIRAGATLQIPLGTACIDCPVPPEVIVPLRRVPPSTPAILTRPAEALATQPPDGPQSR
jgi:murein endopeptidase